MTDPIVFSKDKSLKNVDWGSTGIKNWMDQHQCNSTCKQLNMKVDRELTEKMLNCMRRFKDGSFDRMFEQLKMLAD